MIGGKESQQRAGKEPPILPSVASVASVSPTAHSISDKLVLQETNNKSAATERGRDVQLLCKYGTAGRPLLLVRKARQVNAC